MNRPIPLPPAGEIPTISPRARTTIYLVCLLLNVASFAGFGLAALFEWLPPAKATAAAGIVAAAVGMISSGMALGYRPTRAEPSSPIRTIEA